MMEPEAQIRNLRDFLMVYNRMTEICFRKCTSNFNYRTLTMDEERCADSCAGKLIRSNHRLMGTYVNLMPGMVQRRMAEMEKKNAEVGGAAGALEGAEPTEAARAFDSPLTEVHPVRSLSTTGTVTDITPVQAPPTTPGLSELDLSVSSGPGEAEAPPTNPIPLMATSVFSPADLSPPGHTSSSPAAPSSTTEVSMETIVDLAPLKAVPDTFKRVSQSAASSIGSVPIPSSRPAPSTLNSAPPP
ncbi:hypothetical protein UPYG_G00129880 [Umbra pygmaea]|uniref:Tim10-like domain-containing protein n=1 Tax=Umbra pygmaea TaxID=75934 RepID=A0ABD0XAN9_UMBPY